MLPLRCTESGFVGRVEGRGPRGDAPETCREESQLVSRGLFLSRKGAFFLRTIMNDAGPDYRQPGTNYGQRPNRLRWFPIVIGLVFVVAATLILLILFYPTSFGFAQPSPDRYGLFGGVFLAFFILIVVFFIARVAFWTTRTSRYGRRYRPESPGGYGPNRPEMVARMRYARGEITRAQFEQIMKDLGRGPGSL
jgi:uncharacterized membrane protein